MKCPQCAARGDAHFHWCTKVGGPGRRPTVAPVKRSPKAAPIETPTGGGEPPVGPDPAPASSVPPATSVRAGLKAAAQRVGQLPRRARPTITRPAPEYPRAEALRIVRLRDEVAEPTPAQQWRWMAGEAGNADWGKIDDDALGAFALKLRDFCAVHGLPITVKIRDDVLAVQGFDEDGVRSTLLHPEHVEVRPESWNREKRYPVLGFRRGDVVVILGLRDPDAPAVIAAYWTSLLSGYDPLSGTRERTGGGGNKVTGSSPTTLKALVKRLTAMGAHVEPEWQISEGAVTVTYDGQDLGKITVGAHVPRDVVDSDWNRMQRKIGAIDQRSAASRGQR